MWRRVCYCVSPDFQEHSADVPAPQRDELTGFSRLHKSSFHPTVDSRLEGRFHHTAGRDKKLLTSRSAPPPPVSEDPSATQKAQDRHTESKHGHPWVFKDGEAESMFRCDWGWP